jgi:hypothetical protein
MFMGASAIFHHEFFLLPILLCLFWFMLQCWQWHEHLDLFKVNWRSLLRISVTMVLFVGVAIQLGFFSYMPAVLVLFGITVTGPWLTSHSQFWRNALFSLMMIAIVVIMLQIITIYPIWLTALMFVILAIFVLFNRSFYAFFRQKRGTMFAVAVVPFHMLYFLYSMAAFALGTLIYYHKSGLPVSRGQASGKN